MRNVLVTAAFALYVETVPLASTDINTDSHRWHDLYAKECQLFDLLRQMDWEESEEYKHMVWVYNNDNGISNKVRWQDQDPDY